MDWNAALLLNTLVIAGLIAVRTLMGPARGSTWTAAAAAVLAITGVSWVVAPGIAGFVGAAVTAVGLLGPLLMRARAQTLARGGAFAGGAPARGAGGADVHLAASARWSRWAAWLHPSLGLRREAAFARADALVAAGDLPRAEAELAAWIARDPGADVGAVMLQMAWRSDWRAVERHLLPVHEARPSAAGVATLPLLVCALAETGQLARAVGLVRRYGRLLEANPVAADVVRLALLAYAGAEDAVEALLARGVRGSRRLSPAVVRATAASARGDGARADALLAPLAASPDAAMRHLLLVRAAARAAGATVASPALGPDDAAFVEAVRRETLASRALEPNVGAATPAVWCLAVAWVGVWCASEALGGSTEPRVLYEMGALYTGAAAPEVWRFVLAGFLHAGSAHLASNLLGLFWIGRTVERLAGGGRLVAIALVANGVAAVAALEAARAGLTEDGLLVGASGAVMGMVGALGALCWRARHTAPTTARRLARQLGWMVGLQVLVDRAVPQVSGTAHLAGLVGGALLMLVVPRRPR